MAAHLALVLAGAMLASASGSGTATPPREQFVHAESFSLAAGRALGAAASCNGVSGRRIERAANRLGRAIERLARDPAERGAAHRRLVEGVGQGGSAVDLGALDCASATRALAEIERQLPK